MIKNYFIAIASLLVTLGTSAQVTEGKVSYNVKNTVLDADEALKGKLISFQSSLDVFFVEGKSRIDFSVNDSMSISIIMDLEKNEGIKLLNSQMGKFAVPGSAKDMGWGQSTSSNSEVVPTEETKEIMGYTCTKYIVKSGQGDLEYWCTDQISMDFSSTSIMNANLPGFPLSFYSISDGMKMEFTAVRVETSLEKTKKIFSTKRPKDYSLLGER